jgi:hypothetical protein
MHVEHFNKTTIGADYLRTGQVYPIDALLDYLSGLKKMKAENEQNEVWEGRQHKNNSPSFSTYT